MVQEGSYTRASAKAAYVIDANPSSLFGDWSPPPCDVHRQVVYARHRHTVMEFTSVTCIRAVFTKSDENFSRFYTSMNDEMMLDSFIGIKTASSETSEGN
jgi:hypothetical protein